MKESVVIRGATIIAGATMLSRILGLVREQVFAYLFGAGFYTDAFNIAFRIPNLLRDLFAEGAMSSAFVPVYTQARKEKGDAYAWNLLSNITNILFCVLTPIIILGIIFSGVLVHLYAPAFQQIPGKHELTVSLTQIMFPFLLLVVFASISMGALNARERFGSPAMAPTIFNIASIAAAFILCPLMPRLGLLPIWGMAFGVLLGGLGQWLVQSPTLYNEGYRYRFVLQWNKECTRIIALLGVGTIGLAATQISILVNSILASGQGEGPVSWLNYAFRLVLFPIGVFGVALSQATLTRVADQMADNKIDDLKKTVIRSLRMAFAVTIPSSAGLIVLGGPIIAIIYEHGKFTSADTNATAKALAFYSIGIAAYAGIKILVPVFYSLGRARFPVMASLSSVLLNIILCVVLVRIMGYSGLALATSMSAILQFILLLIMLAYYTGGIDWRHLLKGLAFSLLAALVMAGVLFYGIHACKEFWLHGKILTRLFLLGCALMLAVVVYGLTAKSLGLDEFVSFWNYFLEKIRRRRNSG